MTPYVTPVTAPTAEHHHGEPDNRLVALRLAVSLYTGQSRPADAVRCAAEDFHRFLSEGTGVPPDAAREILTTLHILTSRMENIMTALDNLTSADTALKTEVTTAITDWAAKLAAANSANDPAIQAVADDMNAQVTALQGADSGTSGTVTAGTSAGGTTGTPTAAPVTPTPGTSN